MEYDNIQKAETSLVEVRDWYTQNINSLTVNTPDVLTSYLDITRFETDVHLSLSESVVLRFVSYIRFQTEYHIIRTEWYASPSFFSIVMAIWGVIQTVWSVIQAVASVLNILETFHINDLLYKLWPWYAEQIDKVRIWLGSLSDVLGWGVDGLLHIINATQAGFTLLGGLKKGDWEGVEVRWLDNAESTIKQIQNHVDDLENQPGKVIANLFMLGQKDLWADTWIWWNKVESKITNATDNVEKAFFNIGQITTELNAIHKRMPYFVEQYIPQRIWDSLENTDYFINEKILPTIHEVNESIDALRSILDFYSFKTNQLVERLAMPGDVLAEVDNLYDYLRVEQERKIDDVTSRELGRHADTLLEGISGDLDEFEKIDAAIKAPTPEPEFLDIESPQRRALAGIVEEDRETWMIGGYEDQL